MLGHECSETAGAVLLYREWLYHTVKSDTHLSVEARRLLVVITGAVAVKRFFPVLPASPLTFLSLDIAICWVFALLLVLFVPLKICSALF